MLSTVLWGTNLSSRVVYLCVWPPSERLCPQKFLRNPQNFPVYPLCLHRVGYLGCRGRCRDRRRRTARISASTSMRHRTGLSSPSHLGGGTASLPFGCRSRTPHHRHRHGSPRVPNTAQVK